MKSITSSIKSKPLNWSWDQGIGFLPLKDNQISYDEKYFNNYLSYVNTERGIKITNFRCEIVEKWSKNAPVLDVGIGCGDFVSRMNSRQIKCFGTDINEVGINWLKNNNYYWDGQPVESATFWDVLEHIEDAKPLFEKINPKFVFVSMPIYKDENHALTSKHFKPGEHCWYFTSEGLISYMKKLNFAYVEQSSGETDLGREGVETFVFKKFC